MTTLHDTTDGQTHSHNDLSICTRCNTMKHCTDGVCGRCRTPEEVKREILEEGSNLVKKYLDNVKRLDLGLPCTIRNGEFSNWLSTALDRMVEVAVAQEMERIYQEIERGEHPFFLGK